MTAVARIGFSVAIVLTLGTTAAAHHIRGIPHYSYQDHYPETPVYELTEVVDGYLVTFTYYQIPRPDGPRFGYVHS